MMSAGHSTALNRFLRLCWKELITKLLGTRGFNHWFNAALAEFELHFWSLQYLGNTNRDGDEATLLAAQSEKPINGICRRLDAVLAYAKDAPLYQQTLLPYQSASQTLEVHKSLAYSSITN